MDDFAAHVTGNTVVQLGAGNELPRTKNDIAQLERRLAAFHEAGHAVVGLALGVFEPDEVIEINLLQREFASGGITVPSWVGPEIAMGVAPSLADFASAYGLAHVDGWKSQILAWCAQLLAGEIAEEMAGGEAFSFGIGLEYLYLCVEEDARSNSDLTRVDRALRWVYPQALRRYDAFAMRSEALAREVLELRRGDLEDIASAVFASESRRLDGDALESVLSRVERIPPGRASKHPRLQTMYRLGHARFNELRAV